jgi:hypothetical protein
MNELSRLELENRLRRALKEHQHEGLNMIGNADQLLHRLADAVEEFIDDRPLAQQKSA